MTKITFLAAAVGFVPYLFLPAHLNAQPAEQPPAEPQVQRALISLSFPGGTVAEYVEVVLKTAKDINIVVMPEAREFEVPPLTLTSVDVGSAMQLLNGRIERQGRGVVELGVEEISPFQGNGRAIYSISSSVGPPNNEPPDEAGVWTITELLNEETKAQDVLTAIQTAVDLAAERYGPTQIKFHEATGLVIAQGHVQQMHTIEQVVKRLREGLSRRRSKGPSGDQGTSESADRSTDAAKDANQNLSVRLATAEQQIGKLQQEKTVLEAELARMREAQKQPK